MPTHIIISSDILDALGLFPVSNGSDEEVVEASFCPMYVKRIHIDLDYACEVDPMKEYFKSHCIGEPKDNVKRLKSGAKSADHRRVDKQINVFLNDCQKRGFEASYFNSNIGLMSKYKDYTVGDDEYCIWVADYLDLFPCVIDDGKVTVAEVVLTTDVESEFFALSKIRSAHGCWGDPKFVPKTKALISHFLVRTINMDAVREFFNDTADKLDIVLTEDIKSRLSDCSFHYLVFGKSKSDSIENQHKIVEYPMNKQRRSLLYKLLDSAIKIWIESNTAGWEPNPKAGMCKRCPVEDCTYKTSDVVL